MSTSTSPSLPVPLPFPAPLVVRVKGSRLPKIDSGNDLIANTGLVVPQEIVPGLLHAGTKAVLASGSKAGKTWVLLDLATSIATGTPFLKWPTTPGKVLFVNFEIHPVFMKERLQKLKEGKQLPNFDNFNVCNLRARGANVETLMEEIIDRVRNERYALVVLDPIYKMMVGRNENTAVAVGILCHQIERLAERTGAAVVYAHHFTKGNGAKKKAIDRLSGSGVFARDADTIITFTEHEEEGCYVVEITLRNLPPQLPFVVQWRYPVMVERPDLDPADLKRAEGEKAQDDLAPLLELLNQKPLTTGEWKKAAEADGYTHATFYRSRKKLLRANRVQRDRKDRTWSQAAAQPDSTADGATPDTAETDDTFDTFDTFETAETGIRSGQEVSSIKSIKSLKDHA